MKLSQADLNNPKELLQGQVSEDTQRLDRILTILARGMFSQIELEEYQIYHSSEAYEVQVSADLEEIKFFQFNSGREAIDFVLSRVVLENE